MVALEFFPPGTVVEHGHQSGKIISVRLNDVRLNVIYVIAFLMEDGYETRDLYEFEFTTKGKKYQLEHTTKRISSS